MPFNSVSQPSLNVTEMDTSNGSGSDLSVEEQKNVYHFVLFDTPDKFLAVQETSKEMALACLTPLQTEVNNWELDCEVLTTMVKEEFGVHGCILGPLWRHKSVHDEVEEAVLVMEVLQRPVLKEANIMSCICSEDLLKVKWKPVARAVCTRQLLYRLLRDRVFSYEDSRHPIWRRMGWFWSVQKWVCELLRPLGFVVHNVSHARNTEKAEVLKIEAVASGTAVSNSVTKSRVFYMKTVGQDSCEATLTKTIASFAGGIVPDVVAVNKYWNCFVQEDAGDVYCTPNPRLFFAELAELQKASTLHLEGLKGTGICTYNVKWVINHVEGILRHPLIHGNGRFANTSLRKSVFAIKKLLASLDAYGFPDTLVHGDLHLGNIAGRERKPHMFQRCSIIDWGSAFIGHPLLDVCILLENIDLDTQMASQVLVSYINCWNWLLTVPTLRRLLRIGCLCYWIIDLYHQIRWCERTTGGEEQYERISESVRDVFLITQRLEDSKVTIL